MKKHIFSLTIATVLFTVGYSCQKENTTIGNSDRIFEEAFPGLDGEVKEYLVNGDKIIVEDFGGLYVFQGDIILTGEQLNLGPGKGGGLGLTNDIDFIRPWSCNKVPFSISPSMSYMKEKIMDALNHFMDNTDLEFVEWTGEPNYMEFVSSETAGGNASYCGMIGGQQLIWLSNDAPTASIIHEIGHAIGLIHEHSRKDRDEYILIKEENILPGKEHNFRKINNLVQTNGFDFNSIMSYPSDAFSKNGKATITRLDQTEITVTSRTLQEDDIQVINDIYTIHTINDIDGNIYRTVMIGNQTWMAENLKTTKFADGTSIPESAGNIPWSPIQYDTYCWYENDPKKYKSSYGGLYNGYAARGNRICPTGWHVPNYDEWAELINYLGGAEIAGAKLKEIGLTHWSTLNSDASDDYCFSARPGGFRSDKEFGGIGNVCFFWTATWENTYGFPGGCFIALDPSKPSIGVSYSNVTDGYSVRCIKNSTP